VHELYFDLVVFGTGAIYVEGADDGVRFGTRHIAEISISEDANGVVDTVYRKFKMTARAIEQQFGRDALPPAVLKDVENSPYTEHTILHAVYPRAGKPGRAAKTRRSRLCITTWTARRCCLRAALTISRSWCRAL
jgi:hypothetical protein